MAQHAHELVAIEHVGAVAQRCGFPVGAAAGQAVQRGRGARPGATEVPPVLLPQQPLQRAALLREVPPLLIPLNFIPSTRPSADPLLMTLSLYKS